MLTYVYMYINVHMFRGVARISKGGVVLCHTQGTNIVHCRCSVLKTSKDLLHVYSSELCFFATRIISLVCCLLNPLPTKDVYIRPVCCHATTEDVYVYIRPQTKDFTECLVVHDALNKSSLVVEKGLALLWKDH